MDQFERLLADLASLDVQTRLDAVQDLANYRDAQVVDALFDSRSQHCAGAQDRCTLQAQK